MRALDDFYRPNVPEWEPEPLHLPAGDLPDDESRRRILPLDQGDDDLPGSHVIVIDLA